ncbi:MAG: XrtA-associated ATPase [Alphaproteobacteria bacterium]|nr:XrtA-associated ATPase [Alphaproteobacteria bacterium]
MDYVSFFGLREAPFNLIPNPRFFFQGTSHRRAFSHLTFGLNKAEGFVVITGEIGAGKTTIIDLLLQQLATSRIQAAKIAATQFEADDFLRVIAHAFELETEGRDKASIYHAFEACLRDAQRAGRRPLLFIDEAQGLPHSALEELRMLSNLQHLDQSLLQICLVGQPELRSLLGRPDLEALRQRIVASYHLTALQEEEVGNYVRHRLKVAGWQGVPELANDCFSLIYRETEGVPRKINKLCDRVLWLAFLEEQDKIARDDVVSVIEEIRTEDFGNFNDPIEVFPEGEIPFSASDLMKTGEEEPERDANIVDLHGDVHLADTAPEPEPRGGEIIEDLSEDPVDDLDEDPAEELGEELGEDPADDPQPIAHTTVLRDDMPPVSRTLKRRSHAEAEVERAAVKPDLEPEPDDGTRVQGPRTDHAFAAGGPHETLRPTRRIIPMMRVFALVALVLLGTGSWYAYSKGLVAVSDIDRVLTWAGLEFRFAAPDRSTALERIDQVKQGTGPLQQDPHRTQPARLALPATPTVPPAEIFGQKTLQDRDIVLVRETALPEEPSAEAVSVPAPDGGQAAADSGSEAATSQVPTLTAPAPKPALPGKIAVETEPADAGEIGLTAAQATDSAVTSQLALRAAPERSADGDLSETEFPTPTSATDAQVQPQRSETPGALATDTAVATPPPQSDADGRILLRAIGDCWIEVRDGSGAMILSRLLQAGESYQVPKEGNPTLLAVNAGGLQIEVDGKILAPLGPKGAVRGNIALNPESLLKSLGLAP